MDYQMDPALLEAVTSMNAFGPQQDQYKRQLQMAQMLRGNAMDQLQRGPQMVGKVAVPMSPLAAVAGVLNTRKAGQMEGAADQGLQGLGQKRSDIARQYFGALTKKPQQPQAGTPVDRPEGYDDYF